MTIPMFNESFVAVPTGVSAEEFALISETFGKHRVPVLYGRELPVADFSGGGPAVVEFLNWLVSIEPSTFKELSLWALATYAGKEFVSGFAKDAGKDFWNGVKALGELASRKIARNQSKDKQYPFFVLKSFGKADGGTRFGVEIDVPTTDDELLFTDRYYEIQRFFLPLVGCLSFKLPEVDLRIQPLKPGQPELTWLVWNLHSNVAYEVDCAKRLFRQRSYPPAPTDITIECLSTIGLTFEPTQKRRRFAFWRSR